MVGCEMHYSNLFKAKASTIFRSTKRGLPRKMTSSFEFWMLFCEVLINFNASDVRFLLEIYLHIEAFRTCTVARLYNLIPLGNIPYENDDVLLFRVSISERVTLLNIIK